MRGWGEPELARAFFLRVTDKCHPDWDVTKQARAELGETDQNTVNVWCYPHIYHDYSTSLPNISPSSKVDLSKKVNFLWRISYARKDAPYAGKLSIIPKIEMSATPGNMKAEDGGDGKKVYTVTQDTTSGGDFWYNSFVVANKTGNPPDGLEITRSWEKTGNNWGECTIKIKSTTRWYISITMPNNKTNVNNLNTKIRPNEVRDNGMTFYWDYWATDPTKEAFVIKIPVEIDAVKYYPRIRMEHSTHGWFGYGDKHETLKESGYDMKEFTVKMSSEKPFAYHYSFPGNTVFIMNEVKD